MLPPLALLASLCLLRGCSAYIIRILDIDPAAQGACPSGLLLETGIGGEQLCARGSHPSSSVLAAARAAMNAAGHAKGLRRYSRVNGTMRAYQKGTTEAFDPGLRDGSGIDSSDYVDGVSITRGSPRTHLFTFAVSSSYDTNLGSGLCPCGPTTSALVCAATPPAPTYLGGSFACDSGNYGTLSLDWEPREMAAQFDIAVGSVDDDVEVRVMCDQPDHNEDVGLALLQIDVHELEDHDPPLLVLGGSSNVSILMNAVWSDPGATCTDGVDGPLVPNVSGTIDTSAPSLQTLLYTCSDLRGNLAVASRNVTVLDTIPPEVTIRGDVRSCLLQEEPYAELGAQCSDNVDGFFEAQISGGVDPSVLGSYSVLYTCTDSSQNSNSSLRRVVVVSNAFPGSLALEHVELQTSLSGLYEAAGARTILANVNTATDIHLYWSGAYALNTEECRFATLLEHSASGTREVVQFESMLLHPSDTVSGPQLFLRPAALVNLTELTTYTLVVDEHFIRSVSGAGEGNIRQKISFTTGKYSAPGVASTSPSAGETAFPTWQTVELTFGEPVQGGALSEHLNVTLLENGTTEGLPCDGSPSASGLRLVFGGLKVSLSLEGWPFWRGCRDYSIQADVGCFLDATANRNPSAALAPLRFVTACVTALSPARGSTGIAAAEPIVVTFADPVQMGTGTLELRPLGEDALVLGASHYPMVYADGRQLTIDLACRTKRCRLLSSYSGANSSDPAEEGDGNTSAPVQLNASLGICAGRTVQQCMGKVYSLVIGPSAVRLANGSWPQHSILGQTDTLPAQLESGTYSFTLREADLTPPVFLYVDVAASAEDSLIVTAHLNKNCTVHCAAFREWGDANCTSLELLVEHRSESRCGNETREDCTDCAPPSFGCRNRTVMWVDDGCAGLFRLQGRDLVCESWEQERTVYDGSERSVLSLGWRHACALHRHPEDSMPRCWGKADYIDPVTFGPPAVDMLAVAAGYMHTCGVDTTGRMRCWGVDQEGETAPNASLVFSTVTSGYRFSCGLRRDSGEAECWGLNDEGQADAPRGVAFLAISAGNRHVCGVRRNDTTVQCWGWGSQGQTLPPPGVRFLARGPGGAPLPEASVSAGWYHTCAIREDTGQIMCWGSNVYGQSNVPTGDATFVQVASGRAHTCAIHKTLPGTGIDPNGTVTCWGINDQGQATAPSGAKFSALAADDDYTCGIRMEDNSLACWGRDDYGQASPPSGESFGVLDEFVEVNCSADDRPGKDEVAGLVGSRDTGASATASRSAVTGYAAAELELRGLVSEIPYWVYCFAEDEEFPVPNVMSVEQMFQMRRLVTTLDTSPPVMQVLRATATSPTSAEVTVALSEPGTVYCLAVRDREAAPTGRDVVRSGSSATIGQGTVLEAQVLLAGLAPDQEYDVYCSACDSPAGGAGATGAAVANWVSDAAVLQSRTRVHTLLDATPPLLLARAPAHQGLFSCTPDGLAPGCMTTMDLTFSEDVRAGVGNLSLTCLTNRDFCLDIDVPMEAAEVPTADGVSAFFENSVLHITFASPLVDASRYQVSFTRGAVEDMEGNAFELDEECESWFNKEWQTSWRPCVPAYVVNTPS